MDGRFTMNILHSKEHQFVKFCFIRVHGVQVEVMLLLQQLYNKEFIVLRCNITYD